MTDKNLEKENEQLKLKLKLAVSVVERLDDIVRDYRDMIISNIDKPRTKILDAVIRVKGLEELYGLREEEHIVKVNGRQVSRTVKRGLDK